MINDAGKHEVKPSRRGAPKLKVLPVEVLSRQVSDIDGVNVYGRRVGVRGSVIEIAAPLM